MGLYNRFLVYGTFVYNSLLLLVRGRTIGAGALWLHTQSPCWEIGLVIAGGTIRPGDTRMRCKIICYSTFRRI